MQKGDVKESFADIADAERDFGFKPTTSISEGIPKFVEWYKEYYQNQNQSMYDFTINQIESYTKAAKLNNIAWANND